MTEKPNQYRDTDVENGLEKKPGFELPQAQAENLAKELSSVANLVSHDQPVKKEDMKNLDLAVQGMKIEEIEQIPDLEKNTKIWQEIKGGNFENTPKLTYITYEIAQFLAANAYHIILNSITSITDEVAEALSHAKSRIELMRLASLSDIAAEHLSYVKGELYLGMASLSDSVAERLSKYRGVELTFDNLETLSDNTAKYLSNYAGTLRLRKYGIEFSDEAAISLAHTKGQLEFQWGKNLQQAIDSKIVKIKK